MHVILVTSDVFCYGVAYVCSYSGNERDLSLLNSHVYLGRRLTS